MFQTQKKLMRRIAELEGELAAERRKTRESAIISKAALPKCKGLYCYQCAYAVFKTAGLDDWAILLGCGKHAECEDFTPVYDKTKTDRIPVISK